jgi:prepilin-type N-terminal cleavage/methylation domain-containing protein
MMCRSRPGYTLLEVLLAAAIGVLLLAALYAALDMQLNSAQNGRDVVERTTLARSLLNRMTGDITLSLGNIDPSRYRSRNSSSSSTATTSTPSGQGTTSNSTTGATGSTSSTTQQPTQQAAGLTGAVQFNLYVQGESDWLTLYVSRLPRELSAMPSESRDPQGQVLVSDLRRITYWLAGGADAPLGLARQEIKLATADEALGDGPPDVGDEAVLVIAEEVKELKFSYFDGSAWQESWTGTSPGSDGVTPIGPPRAIAIEITIASSSRSGEGRPITQRFRHVVAIPVADGPTQQTGP